MSLRFCSECADDVPASEVVVEDITESGGPYTCCRACLPDVKAGIETAHARWLIEEIKAMRAGGLS